MTLNMLIETRMIRRYRCGLPFVEADVGVRDTYVEQLVPLPWVRRPSDFEDEVLATTAAGLVAQELSRIMERT